MNDFEAWEAAAKLEKPQRQQAQTRSNIADGFWFTHRESGERCWQTGDMLMSHIRRAVDGERSRRDKALRQVIEGAAKAVGVKFGEHEAAIDELKREIEALKKQLPLRAVAGKDQAA